MNDRIAATGLIGLSSRDLPRRGFAMSALIAGFAPAALAAGASPVHTDAVDLTAGEVKIPVDDGSLPAYRAAPTGPGPFPTILVIEEIFGVHEYIMDVCRRFARAGYLAVAPELYARLGNLSKMTDIQQIIRDVILKAPDARLLADLDATAAWAASNGGDHMRLGVTGFCRGGRNTWLYAAHNPALRAAVAWYGPVKGPTSDIQPLQPVDVADQLRCPLLGLYGGKDPGIAVADVQAAVEKARAAGKSAELVVFPEAGHGFHADYRASYDAEAAQEGWSRALAFFMQHGV